MLPGQSPDDMLVYAKDYDSSADYRILNSLEAHPQSPGINHSKRSIGKNKANTRLPVSACKKKDGRSKIGMKSLRT